MPHCSYYIHTRNEINISHTNLLGTLMYITTKTKNKIWETPAGIVVYKYMYQITGSINQSCAHWVYPEISVKPAF